MRAMRNWAVVAALALLAGAPLVGQDAKKDKPAEKKKAAKLAVKMRSDAELYVDDKKIEGSGTQRTFNTPPLVVGSKYYYVVKSVREPNNYTTVTRTRKVVVKAGETTKVDLTGPDDPKQPDDIMVRYVPTPQSVAEKMLEIAKVGKGDVVYDIGCGDGRIVITAVKKFKAKKGVGIDIDADRIKESKANAKEAGVGDKVDFRKGDALKIKDLENATVIAVYLSDSLMDQLHPIFKKRLKPGTRIISHRFVMKGWEPDKTVVHNDTNIWGEKEDFELHLWTVPAAKGKGEKKKDDKKKGD
jgi:uncharacterized protein (TIGR03000 family)